jgi:hypothetical protein
VVVEATRAIGDVDLRAEDERCTFFQRDEEVKRCHRARRGSSMNTPTWRVSCRCFTTKHTDGYPEVVDCRYGVTEIKNLKVQAT